MALAVCVEFIDYDFVAVHVFHASLVPSCKVLVVYVDNMHSTRLHTPQRPVAVPWPPCGFRTVRAIYRNFFEGGWRSR
jgi:hypothetical protein